MNNVDKCLDDLYEELINYPVVKEYLRLKDLYNKDEELKELRKEIARLKQEGKDEEHKNLLEAYNRHPLVNNYFASREEVRNLLLEIKDILD